MVEAEKCEVLSTWWRRYRVARRCDHKLVVQVWRVWCPRWKVIAVLPDGDNAYAVAFWHANCGDYTVLYQL